MSCVEIYKFDKQGEPYLYGEVHNSFRGGMAIWRYLEGKYLPPFFPAWAKKSGLSFDSRSWSRCFNSDMKNMQEIWDLWKSDSVSRDEKICLMTTFDNVLVKKENIPSVVKAFRVFEGDTNLKEQADILERLISDEDCIAVGWNGTSVNGTTWDNRAGYDEENERHIPYNCLTGNEHWWLFDELDRGEWE